MDVGLIRGLIIIILMISFAAMAIWLWCFADRNKLEQAARMPLDDQPGENDQSGKEHNPQQRTGDGGGKGIEEAGHE